MRNILLTLTLLFSTLVVMGQTSLRGKVTEAESGEPVLIGNITLKRNGVFVTGAQTDLDGNYIISNLDPGTYDVEVSYVGLQTKQVTGVRVEGGKNNNLDVQLADEGIKLGVIDIVDYRVPLIDKDQTSTGQTITSDDIKRLPTRSIGALAATTAGLTQDDEGGGINIRGSRDNATNYYVDGVRVSNTQIPETEIDQLQVVTGGLEARYGDVTGGIISITTKGPSAQYTGGFEAETSVEGYRNSLIGANLSGPILKRKSTGQSILGFRLAGRYTDQKDNDIPATDVYVASDETIQRLEANPLYAFNSTRFPTAETLKTVGKSGTSGVDVWRQKYAPNERNKNINLTGKIDARLSDAIDITLGGSYEQNEDFFTPDATYGYSKTSWRLLNAHNNPKENETNYRVNFRFRHRLGANDITNTDDKKSNAVIRNASYTLQAAWEKSHSKVADIRHGNNLFNYGYIGKFDYQWNPTFEDIRTDELGVPIPPLHLGYFQDFNGYTPGTVNPVLAAYNNGSDTDSETNLFSTNGFVSTSYSRSWDLFNNVGTVFNRSSKSENDLYTFNASSSFDFLPGGSEKGSHNIQFGFLYEQRVDRNWTINPFELWRLARLSANGHIVGIDTSALPIDTLYTVFQGSEVPMYVYPNRISDNLGDADLLFYKELRKITNQSLAEYANVDALSPEQLSLSMFSPAELAGYDDLDFRYHGFDYTGTEKTSRATTFKDFFTQVDERTGLRAFPVAPNQPIYAAAYIQDKFTFKDIIFRLGLRVDRYDANTKVMADPYSLYPIISAKEFYETTGATNRPANVGDDFKVYVEGEGSTTVRGFRNGDQWYFASGQQANDGNVVFLNDEVTPDYKYSEEQNDIRSKNFNPDISFVDYEPQVNWMPRIAVSFPISDDANFFAHYDILAQRPPSNTIATALDYYFFTLQTPENNPNLKPERTIDYEVGFRQKLTNTSALTISAFYKELRDMIQRRTYLYIPAPVTQYDTYGNIDFGTTKGFSFTYDLRRTGNVSFKAGYTLQFAEGTGSDADSQRGLTTRGNLRTLFPLNFDERHRLTTEIDYRYDEGKRYNGPRIGGVNILENFGINFLTTLVSGRPYTAKNTPARFAGDGTKGSINGARKPWVFNIGLRVDKTFNIKLAKGKDPLGVNVYVRISNLLNTKNVLRVYPATGSPTDDGYLQSAIGLRELDKYIAEGRDIEAFQASYQWRLLNPDNYTLPRRIFVGASFNF